VRSRSKYPKNQVWSVHAGIDSSYGDDRSNVVLSVLHVRCGAHSSAQFAVAPASISLRSAVELGRYIEAPACSAILAKLLCRHLDAYDIDKLLPLPPAAAAAATAAAIGLKHRGDQRVMCECARRILFSAGFARLP